MKCPKCGIEITSNKVFKIHIANCKAQNKPVQEEKQSSNSKVSDEEIRTRAKELKIRNWHNKKIDNLIKEMD